MSFPGTPDQPIGTAPRAGDPAGAAPYGPQTAAIRRFLQRFAALPTTAWDAAALTHTAAANSAAGLAADRDLARAVERAGRTGERDAVLGPLAQLVRIEGAEPESDAGDDDAPIAMHPVTEAALAALLALVVRDVLPPRAFAALYAPFATAIPVAALEG